MKRKLTILTCFMVLCSFVFGQNHWKPNKDTGDGFTMTITSVVAIDGVEQKSDKIEVGVFYGDDVRGSYILEHAYKELPGNIVLYDRYVAYLTIYGEQGETYSLKLYDHESETELDVVSENTISFNSNTDYDIRNPFVINFFTPVAEVDNVKYATLQEAFTEADNDDVVKVIANHTISSCVVIEKDITLDLNGCTVSYASTEAKPAFRVLGNVTVKDSKTNGSIVTTNEAGNNYCFIVGQGETSANLTIESGLYDASNGGTSAISVTKGNLEITGGEFKSKLYAETNDYRFLINCMDNPYANGTATVNITGGKFHNFNPENNLAEGTKTNFCPEKYFGKKSGDVYTVVGPYEAMIEETQTGYETLAAAFEAAESDASIRLLASTQGSGLVIDKDVTIDFGGHTYSFTEGVGSTNTTSNGFQILKDNTVTLKNGTLNVAEGKESLFGMLIQNYADLTITDMTLDGNGLDKSSSKSYVVSVNCGNVVINGNTTIIANQAGNTNPFALDSWDYTSAGYALPTVTINTTGEINGNIEVTSILDIKAVGNFTGEVVVYGENAQLYSNASVKATLQKKVKAYVANEDNSLAEGWYTISLPFENVDNHNLAVEGEAYELFRYNEPTAMWLNHKGSNFGEGFNLGTGYLYAHKDGKNIEIKGKTNVDNTSVALTKTDAAGELAGFNLVGNPFTHNITKANFNSTNLAEGFYTLSNHGAWETRTETDVIAVGEGVLVQTTENAEVVIANSATRSRNENNGSLQINVANNNYSDVAYVSFNEGIGLSKIAHQNANIPLVYVPVEGVDYAIATMSQDVEEIPFAFEAMTMGTYTISIEAQNCEFSTITLVDRFTGIETNMLFEDYSFIAKAGDNSDRFIIRLSTETLNLEEENFAFINNNGLIINASSNATLQIFDVMGRPVSSYNVDGNANVSMESLTSGVYILRLIDENNVRVQKVVID